MGKDERTITVKLRKRLPFSWSWVASSTQSFQTFPHDNNLEIPCFNTRWKKYDVKEHQETAA